MQLASGVGFYSTFIYSFNERVKRVELWDDLMKINILDPWMLCWDFNCVMSTEERLSDPIRDVEIKDILECMSCC